MGRDSTVGQDPHKRRRFTVGGMAYGVLVFGVALAFAGCGSGSGQASLTQATQKLLTAKSFTVIERSTSIQSGTNGSGTAVVVIDHNGSASDQQQFSASVAYATPNGTVAPSTQSTTILADRKQFVRSSPGSAWVVNPDPAWFSATRYLTDLDMLDSGTVEVQGSSFRITHPNPRLLWTILGQNGKDPNPVTSAQLSGTLTDGRIATIHLTTEGKYRLKESEVFERVGTSPQVEAPQV